MVNDPQEQVMERLRSLVTAGAEIEQRDVGGETLWEGPLARDTVELEQDGEQCLLWFRPLYGHEGVAADGRWVFGNNDHQPRPLQVARLDLLGEQNVGVAHVDTGTYSVIRPVSTDERREMIDRWDDAHIL